MNKQKFDSILAKPSNDTVPDKELAAKISAVAAHPIVDILNDQPATQDELGFRALVKTIAGVVLSEQTQTPITLAVDGEWGTGKTSVLKMVEAQAKLIGMPCIWLNAWGLESSRNMIQALGLGIEDELVASGRKAIAAKMPKYLNADYVLTSRSFRELIGFLHIPDDNPRDNPQSVDDAGQTDIQKTVPVSQQARILIITAAKEETQAVLNTFLPGEGKSWSPKLIGGKLYYDLGTHGGSQVFMAQSEMGAATPGGSLLTVRRAIQDLTPQAIIMCGIAFGLRPERQAVGDILVAKTLSFYEAQKLQASENIELLRGDRVRTSSALLERFRESDMTWQGATVHFGDVISAENLVTGSVFQNQLLQLEPEAIGGEMEGAGLYAAARDNKIDWILVKAIGGWVDGVNSQENQSLAVLNGARFILHTLQDGEWGNMKSDDTASFSALEMAKRSLDILEKQAAAYTSLTLPTHLSITLEDKRTEVRKLERGFQQSTIQPSEIIKTELPQAPKRVIIFIDDIDRALPDQIANMFKNLKLILEVPNCVFVLAMDMQIVARSIEEHYLRGFNRTTSIDVQGSLRDSSIVIDSGGDNLATKGFGNEYLEKMVQIKFRMPHLTRAIVKNYLTDQGIAQEVLEIVRWAPDRDVLNPRRLKMYVNRLSVNLQFINAARLPQGIDNYQALKLVALRKDHPGIYNLLTSVDANGYWFDEAVQARCFPYLHNFADLHESAWSYLRFISPEKNELGEDSFYHWAKTLWARYTQKDMLEIPLKILLLEALSQQIRPGDAVGAIDSLWEYLADVREDMRDFQQYLLTDPVLDYAN